jgi:hypothetical protein
MVVYTDPAAEDEGDLDLLRGGSRPLEENEQIHFCNLKDRYQQRRDRSRQLVVQLSTLNSRKKHTELEVRLRSR